MNNPQINQLENFFKSIDLPTEPIMISLGEKIVNLKLFIDSHFRYFKSYHKNKNKTVMLSYWNNLIRLKNILEIND